MYVCVCIRVYVSMCTCEYVCMWVDVYVSMWVDVYVCTCVFLHDSIETSDINYTVSNPASNHFLAGEMQYQSQTSKIT